MRKSILVTFIVMALTMALASPAAGEATGTAHRSNWLAISSDEDVQVVAMSNASEQGRSRTLFVATPECPGYSIELHPSELHLSFSSARVTATVPCVGLIDVTWQSHQPPAIETGTRWFGTNVGCGPDGSNGHLAFMRSSDDLDMEFSASGVVGNYTLTDASAFLFHDMSQIVFCS